MKERNKGVENKGRRTLTVEMLCSSWSSWLSWLMASKYSCTDSGTSSWFTCVTERGPVLLPSDPPSISRVACCMRSER